MTNIEQDNTTDVQQTLQENATEQKQQTDEILEVIDVVDPKDERIATLEAELVQAQQRERDGILRAKAEAENVRRRSAQDIEKAHKFALEHFVSELLPVIDNMERAIDISSKNNIELKSIIQGVELTLKSLLNVVGKFGLNVINDTHIAFNPELHQAMNIIESDDITPNQVMVVIQKGYTLNGRLIRPAMVTVSKAKS